MTPAADLMRLVEKWPLDRHPDPHTDAWTLGYLRAKRECADELQAALSAPGEARGGGEAVAMPREVVEIFANCLPLKHKSMPYAMEALGFIRDEAREALATHAHPKASEGKAGGEAVAFAIQGPDGTISMLGWMPMRHREALQNLCVLTPGARFVYAYANLNLPETDDA